MPIAISKPDGTPVSLTSLLNEVNNTAMPITISKSDGTPISLTELASEANFISKPGGSLGAFAHQKFKCPRCNFMTHKWNFMKQHAADCNGGIEGIYRDNKGLVKFPTYANTKEIKARFKNDLLSTYSEAPIVEDVDELDIPIETFDNEGLTNLIGIPGLQRSIRDKDSDAGSAVSSSVATSAITLQSTLHSRNRMEQRQLSRRDLQAAAKNGKARRSHTGHWMLEDDKTCVVIASNDLNELRPVPRNKVIVTAWSK